MHGMACVVLLIIATLRTIRGELILLQIIFRNVPRVPEVLYPNDPYKNFWKDRERQIPKTTMTQFYQVGQRLQTRYNDFLESFSPKADFLAYDNDACISTEQCFMSGFFKPRNGYTFFDEFPAFANEGPGAVDSVFQEELACPQMYAATSEMYRSEEGYKLINENKHLYEYWSVNSGMDIRNPTDAGLLYESLDLERNLNLTPPPWAERFWDDLKGQFNHHFSRLANAKRTQRLTAGPLLGMMIRRMQDHIDRKNEEKVFVYSGKNSNVAGLLGTFGAFNGIEPPFGSTVILELHQFGEEYYVRVLYFTTSTPNIQLDAREIITVEGCTEYCPLENFKELTRSLIPENWEEECGLSAGVSLYHMICLLFVSMVLHFFESI